MSKFEELWKFVASFNQESLTLSFDEITHIINDKINHSFLNYKKELLKYNWQVKKISLKEQKVLFERIKGD